MDSSTLRTAALTAVAVIVGLWLIKKLGDKTAAIIGNASKTVGGAAAAAAS